MTSGKCGTELPKIGHTVSVVLGAKLQWQKEKGQGPGEASMRSTVIAALALGFVSASAQAQSIPVTADNFIRAESDTYIGNLFKEAGGLGKLFHHREPAPIDNQNIIRLNRDTLYSF